MEYELIPYDTNILDLQIITCSLKKQLHTLLKQGVTDHHRVISQVVIVKKESGKIRLCIVGNWTIDSYPLTEN